MSTMKTRQATKPLSTQTVVKNKRRTMKQRSLASQIDPEMSQFLLEANDKCHTLGALIKLQRKIMKNYRVVEQKWVDDNLQPIISFMGETEVWNTMISDVECLGCDKDARSGYIGIPSNPTHPVGIFTGQHWLSVKAGSEYVFDSYAEGYQINGTNQFCQTYALMYLLDKLPPKDPNVKIHKIDGVPVLYRTDSIDQFYDYTLYALLFIKDHVIPKVKFSRLKDYTKKSVTQQVENCIKYHYICLNSIFIEKSLV